LIRFSEQRCAMTTLSSSPTLSSAAVYDVRA
jgi:hypothetical protein